VEREGNNAEDHSDDDNNEGIGHTKEDNCETKRLELQDNGEHTPTWSCLPDP